MTKGAAPGHVCVSTALPGTMTRTHATWRRMHTTTKINHFKFICLNHLEDKTLHVCSGFHIAWLLSVRPAKTHITSATAPQSQLTVSTGSFFPRYLKAFKTWHVFFVLQGGCL